MSQIQQMFARVVLAINIEYKIKHKLFNFDVKSFKAYFCFLIIHFFRAGCNSRSAV